MIKGHKYQGSALPKTSVVPPNCCYSFLHLSIQQTLVSTCYVGPVVGTGMGMEVIKIDGRDKDARIWSLTSRELKV